MVQETYPSVQILFFFNTNLVQYLQNNPKWQLTTHKIQAYTQSTLYRKKYVQNGCHTNKHLFILHAWLPNSYLHALWLFTSVSNFWQNGLWRPNNVFRYLLLPSHTQTLSAGGSPNINTIYMLLAVLNISKKPSIIRNQKRA